MLEQESSAVLFCLTIVDNTAFFVTMPAHLISEKNISIWLKYSKGVSKLINLGKKNYIFIGKIVSSNISNKNVYFYYVVDDLWM